MKTSTTVKTSTIFKALADDMRLTIVRCLAKNDTPVRSCDVVKSCSTMAALSQPAMSHHFKKLVDANIVTTTKAGTENLYILNRETLLTAGIDANKL